MTVNSSGTTPLYENGADHYRSPTRRDPVKLTIEEPVSHRVYDYAMRSLGKPECTDSVTATRES